MDMAACPYTDFSCAGKQRGVARRNPDARKKLVKTKPEIIAEIRDINYNIPFTSPLERIGVQSRKLLPVVHFPKTSYLLEDSF